MYEYDAMAEKLAKVTAAYRRECMRRDDYTHDAFERHLAALEEKNDG